MNSVKVKSMGIKTVPTIDKVFEKTNKDQKQTDSYNRVSKTYNIPIVKRNPYTLITSDDLIKLFINYNIPVARQTIAAIQQEKVFLHKGIFNVIEK